jgi:hypothetical protein
MSSFCRVVCNSFFYVRLEVELKEELQSEELGLEGLRQLKEQLGSFHGEQASAVEKEYEACRTQVGQLSRQLEDKMADLRELLQEEQLLEKQLKASRAWHWQRHVLFFFWEMLYTSTRASIHILCKPTGILRNTYIREKCI